MAEGRATTMAALVLRVRRDVDRVEAAVNAAAARLPPGWPAPRMEGRAVRVPRLPEPIEVTYQEFLAAGLDRLARRVIDPYRWWRTK